MAVRFTADLSGVNELALSLLDVLSGLEHVNICTGCTRGGKPLAEFDPAAMADVQCVYETLPGWSEEIGQCRSFDELPANAPAYVNRVEGSGHCSSGRSDYVGPDRLQTIRHHTALEAFA